MAWRRSGVRIPLPQPRKRRDPMIASRRLVVCAHCAGACPAPTGQAPDPHPYVGARTHTWSVSTGEAEVLGTALDRLLLPLPLRPAPGEDEVHQTRDQQSDGEGDRKSTRLNSSHVSISYAVFCLKKKNKHDAFVYSE